VPSDTSPVAARRQDLGAPLAALLEAWSVDAINLQLGFAVAHEQDLARLADALEPVAAALGPLAAALFPPRLELRTHEVTTRVRVVVDRTRERGITLVPLNLGHDLRYGTTATRESRLCLRVARVPLAGAPLGTPDDTKGDRDARTGQPPRQ